MADTGPRISYMIGPAMRHEPQLCQDATMRRVIENIEADQVFAEMARRGIKPRQRVRVVFEEINDEDLPTAEMAQEGGAFDWLKDEPDIYTMDDVKERNV